MGRNVTGFMLYVKVQFYCKMFVHQTSSVFICHVN